MVNPAETTPPFTEYFNPEIHGGNFFWMGRECYPYPAIFPSLSEEFGGVDAVAHPLGLYGKKWRIAIGRGIEDGRNLYYGFDDVSDTSNVQQATATILADTTDWSRSLRVTGMAGDQSIIAAQFSPLFDSEFEQRLYTLSRVDLSLFENEKAREILSHMTHKDNPYAGYEGGPVNTYVIGDGLVHQEPAIHPINNWSQFGQPHNAMGIVTEAMIKSTHDIPELRAQFMAVVYDKHSLFRNGRFPTAKEMSAFGYAVKQEKGKTSHLRICHPDLDLDINLPLVLR
jgi:hypothetical protein